MKNFGTALMLLAVSVSPVVSRPPQYNGGAVARAAYDPHVVVRTTVDHPRDLFPRQGEFNRIARRKGKKAVSF